MGRILQKWRAAVRYVLWRCGRLVDGRHGARLYDINRTYMLSPARITRALDSRGRDRLAGEASPAPRTPVLEHGCVMAGDWDRETVPFEEMDVWRAFKHRLSDGGRWDETDFYARVVRTIEAGTPLWDCATVQAFDDRLMELERLHADIREHGYRRQKDIPPVLPRHFGEQDEVHLHIGRHGEYLFADGRHRLCIAKLLKIPEIPVKIARRHAEWVALRESILHYSAGHGGAVYAPLTHPDLADIPFRHGHERFDMMMPYLRPEGGAALDIGSHWGYFSHRLDQAGYACTAVERDPHTLDMLRKLMLAENRTFAIIEDSILNYTPPAAFDIVLALNIFHHFIKTEDGHAGLVRLLERLETNIMFFEPHDPAEAQMQTAYRNYAPRAFAEFVATHAGLQGVQRVGRATDGRELFVLGGPQGAGIL